MLTGVPAHVATVSPVSRLGGNLVESSPRPRSFRDSPSRYEVCHEFGPLALPLGSNCGTGPAQFGRCCMRVKLRICALFVLTATVSTTGCTYWRYVSRPELWGMSLEESWEYDRQRNQAMTRSHDPIGTSSKARSETDDPN
jgi:hypothetical protein